jgi:predicted nucleic acid-binding protein
LIAVDTSSLRRFLSGAEGPDVELLARALGARQVVLPPVVLTEILSEPTLQSATIQLLADVPQLEVLPGYWRRAGLLRARLIESGRKAKVADALVAQSCLDHLTPLLTNDRDFRHYEPLGLRLL